MKNMSKKKNNLSQTEWSIMKICWEKGKTSAKTIHEESLKEKKRDYSTVATMLDRLVNKGYLQKEKFGPIWLYEPAAKKPKVVASAIDNFLDTVLDNTMLPLFTHLFQKERLSQKDFKALEELIKKKKEG